MNLLTLYPIVDTLGTRLQGRDPYNLSGTKKFDLKLGPWTLPFNLYVATDVVGEKASSAIVRFKGDLFGYIVSRPHELKLYLFDKTKVGLDSAEFVDLWVTRNINETLAKLRPGLALALQFNEQEKAWSPLNEAPSETVVDRKQEQDSGDPVTSLTA
jgi:hypothetical protein